MLLLLAACRSPAGSASSAASPTPGPLPTSTVTITPTPTFDLVTHVTRTPAPEAQCPTANASAVFTFTRSLPAIETELLAYLNQGGQTDQIQTAFDVWRAEGSWTSGAYDRGGQVLKVDVTGDGVPEILVDAYDNQQDTPQRFFTFGCEAGAYRALATLTSRYSGQRYDFPLIEDMNRDGVPEIVVAYRSGQPPNLYLSVLIFEWDGHDFTNLMAADDTLVNATYAVRDVDHDGTLDLVMSGGQMISPEGSLIPPTRQTVQTWAWNGQNFVRTSVEEGFAAPVYRFQAVREGDAAGRAGKLGLALALYDQAIMDETLLPWNPAWLQMAIVGQETPGASPSPTPLIGAQAAPSPDPEERPRLETYTRYRIGVLYAVQGFNQEAEVEFTLLQDSVPSPSGRPYAQLAAAFWQEYRIRRDIGAACSRAIDYARAHAGEILAPLGSRFYGNAYPDYTPEEICPFK